jgi:hypothetical protein
MAKNYELVFEPNLLRPRSPSGLWSRLVGLRERGGAAIGDAYASVAGRVLDGVEWLEDRNAERKQRRPRTPRAAPLAPNPPKSLPTSK